MNEKQINEWLAAQLATLDTRGMKSPEIKIGSDGTNYVVAVAYGLHGTFHCECGETVAEAWATLRAKVPADEIAQLRDQAKQLLRKAGELEAEREVAK